MFLDQLQVIGVITLFDYLITGSCDKITLTTQNPDCPTPILPVLYKSGTIGMTPIVWSSL